MENNSFAPTTLLETNQTSSDVHCEHDSHIDTAPNNSGNSNSYRKKTVPWYLLIIIMMAIMLITNAAQMRQYKQYADTLEQQAYVLSVSINLLEENLLFKYQVLPQDIGFEDLRSAWIDNPCYETAKPYYDALKQALDYIEGTSDTIPKLEPIQV